MNRKIVKGKVLEQLEEIATFQEEAKKEDINIEESGKNIHLKKDWKELFSHGYVLIFHRGIVLYFKFD